MGAVAGVALLAVLALAAAAVRVAPLVWLLWQPREPQLPVLPVDLTPPAPELAGAGYGPTGTGWPARDRLEAAGARARYRRPWAGAR
jgi:hypothetical protein